MKPSRLALLAFISAIAGCAGGAPPAGGDDMNGDPPPKVKRPPQPKDGSTTAPNCEGIAEHGTCQDGVAVFCDVANNELRRKDCKALGKTCLVDATKGAVCEDAPPPGGGGSGATSCETGVTFLGTCTGGKAIWCDPETSQTVTWDCGADSLTCQVDTCTFDGSPVPGAFCCSAGAPPPPTSECPALGFAGECKDGKARWCNGDTLVEKVCGTGESCQTDTCAEGAYCCPDAPPPANECDTIGIRGVCADDTTVRWCSGGTVQQVTCVTGKTCQIDKCGDGAYCCSP
jgi:hypothetical protein